MSTLRLTDWRRWIATLCVVLAAFVMVERSFANDPCHTLSSAVSYNITDAVSAIGNAGEPSDERNSLPGQQQHHCCSAHVSGMPPAALSGAVVQLAVMIQPMLRDAPPPNGEQGGQDRPPRDNAIV